MSENEDNNSIKSDGSIKDLNEIDRKNILRFFGLLHAVDRRIKPHLYRDKGTQVENDEGFSTKEKC